LYKATSTIKPGILPKKVFSAEIWVKYHKFTSWGKVIGSSVDEADYEKGWYIGNRDSRIIFTLSTRGDNDPDGSFATVSFPAQLRQWYHIVGVYDGENMKLYINGKLKSVSPDQGEIFYENNMPLDIGIYRDADEYFVHKGLIDEVALYNYALLPKQIQNHFKYASQSKADSKRKSFLSKKAKEELKGYFFTMAIIILHFFCQ